MNQLSRKLIRPCALAFAEALAEARADLAQLHHEHQRELADLHRELAEVRALWNELRAVNLARAQQAKRLRRTGVLMNTATDDEKGPHACGGVIEMSAAKHRH